MGEGYFKQRNGLYVLDVMGACGLMTAEQFRGLATAAAELGVPAVKLTTRQTVVLLVAEEKATALKAAVESLGLRVAPYHNVVRPVMACPGSADLCPRALGDALALGQALQERYTGQEVPKDFKISVAGCPRGCTEPYCADFGVVAAGGETYNVALGGFGGSSRPRHGELIARRVPRDAVFAILDHVLERYRALAQPREKLGRAVERLGLEAFLPPAQLLRPAEEPDPVLLELKAFLGAPE